MVRTSTCTPLWVTAVQNAIYKMPPKSSNKKKKRKPTNTQKKQASLIPSPLPRCSYCAATNVIRELYLAFLAFNSSCSSVNFYFCSLSYNIIYYSLPRNIKQQSNNNNSNDGTQLLHVIQIRKKHRGERINFNTAHQRSRTESTLFFRAVRSRSITIIFPDQFYGFC
jgi:hypothetical protein